MTEEVVFEVPGDEPWAVPVELELGTLRDWVLHVARKDEVSNDRVVELEP